MQTIGIAGCPVRALRVTYMGELGWELHLPVEYATTVYDTLMAAGAAHGLVNAGYRAIESCRLEKGYRAWGSDIGPDHTPVEAGLGWAVKLHERHPVPAAATQSPPSAPTECARCSPRSPSTRRCVLLGRETIYRDGERVGWLTSGGFGYTDRPLDRSTATSATPTGVTRRVGARGQLRARGRRRARAGRGVAATAVRPDQRSGEVLSHDRPLSPRTGPDRHHRRRHPRLQHRLLAHQDGRDRRGAARAAPAHRRRHLARRRAGRPAALVAQHHPHARAVGRDVPRAGGRDRSGRRLARDRQPAPGLLAGAGDGAEAADHDGEELRPADGDHLARSERRSCSR